ncbi:MAG: arginase family protein, partial [Lysobacter sp.]
MTDAPATSGLFDWPQVPEATCEPGRLCVLGAPSDRGNEIARGAALGPRTIRRASQALSLPAIRGYDDGDIEPAAAVDPATYLHRLAGAARRAFERGLCPLTLGGDHSITYAPVSVLQEREDICLIWFDAHTDFSPWQGPAAHDH